MLTKDVWLSCIFKRLSVIDLTQLSATCKRLKALTAVRLQGTPWKRLMKAELYQKCFIKAAKANETDMMKLCLKKTWLGTTVIECAYYKACKEGHLDVVKLLDDYISSMTHNERQSYKRYLV